MEYHVTLQASGEGIPVGTLYINIRHGQESASFRYDDSYLSLPQAFALAPSMPLTRGTLHAPAGTLFHAFEDCMPTRWGRSLMLRAERRRAHEENRATRTLFEHNYLAGVDDVARQGALRIWVDGKPVSSNGGVPREVHIPDLLTAADVAAADLDADVADLIAAGSSLGGARPKASIADEHGVLCMAKFPEADESPYEDVCAWEKTTLDLAEACGLRVPKSRLLRVGGRSVLLLKRFDREEGLRIAYLSGMSAIQGSDGESYSYLDLVAFIEEDGAQPERDIKDLWKRILFSSAVGNTDDHMRNHGFLRQRGGWALSPMFDVNPTPGDNPKYLRSGIDYETNEADPRAVVSAAEWYRVERDEARTLAKGMASVLSRWRKVASANGISKTSQDYMASCFEAGVERLYGT